MSALGLRRLRSPASVSISRLRTLPRRSTWRSYASVSSVPGLEKPGDKLHGFRLEQVERFPVFDMTGYRLQHEKTGAEYVHLEKADDANNIFAISFKTNPPDASGVPHILEHTALCGSKK
jgi:presequence protease